MFLFYVAKKLGPWPGIVTSANLKPDSWSRQLSDVVFVILLKENILYIYQALCGQNSSQLAVSMFRPCLAQLQLLILPDSAPDSPVK
jgi:hypothetical protein